MLELVDWYKILFEVDDILFIAFSVCIVYLFLFSLFSLKVERTKYAQTTTKYNYCIFFIVSGNDESIIKSILSFQKQTFPTENYKIYVLLNKTGPKLISLLETMPVCSINIPEEYQVRGKMIEYAIKSIRIKFDVAIIMKTGNIVENNFIQEINNAYHSGGMAIQTHRISIAKISNTSILNSLGEEINNAIYRRGHVNLGFSSSLIGSGMAFNFDWLLTNIDRTKGYSLTKQLEAMLLKQGVFIEYLEHVHVLEEKVNRIHEFSQQRKHWYTAERSTLRQALSYFPRALFSGNFDYCDKIIQWLMPSKFVLLMLTGIIAILLLWIDWSLSLKWWILLFSLMLAFLITIPSRYINFRSILALIALPLLSLSILKNIFRKD
jgi:hypothetical protein